MTLPVSISERLRRLRLEIDGILLADKLAPRNGPVAKSDRDRRRLRLQEIRKEIGSMTEWRKP
jgi:hypothetical protein